MSNVKFFKGTESNFQSLSKEAYSFYLTEDEKNFYYTDKYATPIRLGTNPSSTIKELHTYYSLTTAIKPNTFPPNSNWSQTIPSSYTGKENLYATNCIVYMNGAVSYSDVISFITEAEIDTICGGVLEDKKYYE